MRAPLITIALLASMAGATATAYDPIVLKRGWQTVASDAMEACRGEVRTNGQIYVLSVTGLDPEESGRLTLSNGDMVPIDRTIRIAADGSWQQYYIPVRPNGGETGRVFARVSTPSCAIALDFPWRRHKGWEEPPPLVSTTAR
jgi:hypothetical protein